MKIRSITYFDNPGQEISEEFLQRTDIFQSQSRESFQGTGYPLQTIRFASPPFPLYLKGISSDELIQFALQLEKLLLEQGYAYLSLGPALPSHPDSYQIIPDLIHSTRSTFCSGALTDPEGKVDLAAVRACGKIIHQLAPQDPNGFANLYFAALGNVLPGAPFFPAAYHGAENPAFAIAVEGADLAVTAFQEASSLEEARRALIGSMEEAGRKITMAAQQLEAVSGASFLGIDFSLAPYPDPGLSIGQALETLGLPQLGLHGSLAAAAFLADSIDRADFPHAGFSGLMLPVLEDAILAERAAQGSLGIKDLLLFSAVCGTGLDTIPLPGSVSPDQISAVLLDLAALSLRLDKPLTARLMPIPGKESGDPTDFDFEFFANSRVLALDSSALGGLFTGTEKLEIKKRPGF